MRRIAGTVGVVLALAAVQARADRSAPPSDTTAQLATDAEPIRVGRCDRITRLIGQPRGAVERIMKSRGLTPIELEMIVLPSDASVDAVTTRLIATKLANRELRGIYSNLSGDGCIRPDHRFALDRKGNLYQFDGPAGVVDYTTNQCHTARGWERCNLTGQTRVLYIVPARAKQLVGMFGSNLEFHSVTPPSDELAVAQ